MKFEEYQREASQTALYPRRLKNLEYPTLGLAGEAANVVEKQVFYQQDLDYEK